MKLLIKNNPSSENDPFLQSYLGNYAYNKKVTLCKKKYFIEMSVS